MNGVLGWDIGGVNTKVARVARGGVLDVQARPFEIQRERHSLKALLIELARAVGAEPGDAHAVTMTAELSQTFRTKREGVGFVLDQVVAAFPDACVRVHTVEGQFLDPVAAREAPLAVAAANWAASARLVAQSFADGVLIDVGSTTTDITPIIAGAIAARGRTDPERLREGELIYTGALRTPVEAIAPTVQLWGGPTGIAADGFAVSGDVHLWRGQLSPNDFTAPTCDGRPATREFAGERLARTMCADRDMLDEATISAIADGLWNAQVERIADAVARIVRRHSGLARGPAIVTGLGDFLAAEAARRAGLQATHLSAHWGPAARHAPAAAVALLLDAKLETETIAR